MGTGLGEPVGACRLSRAVPGCALPARGSRGLPLGVAPRRCAQPGSPEAAGGAGARRGGSERSPQVPGSSPRGTPDPLSGCAGTVPVGFVARLLIEGSGRFFILADCISGVEWPRFFKKKERVFHAVLPTSLFVTGKRRSK